MNKIFEYPPEIKKCPTDTKKNFKTEKMIFIIACILIIAFVALFIILPENSTAFRNTMIAIFSLFAVLFVITHYYKKFYVSIFNQQVIVYDDHMVIAEKGQKRHEKECTTCIYYDEIITCVSAKNGKTLFVSYYTEDDSKSYIEIAYNDNTTKIIEGETIHISKIDMPPRTPLQEFFMIDGPNIMPYKLTKKFLKQRAKAQVRFNRID